MNSEWKAFLESRSARIDAAGSLRFADAAPEADCALMDLSGFGSIAVRGPEAQGFLQGQLTNDLAGLAADHSRLGGYCSPRGRMLASFRLFRLDDGIYLQLPRAMVAATVQRLRMHLLRTRATVEDASDARVLIGIAGHCAPALLASRLDEIPEQDNALACDGDLIVIRVPGDVPRFSLLGPPSAMQVLWDELAATASVVGADYWRLLDIRSGIPHVYPQTSDAFVPQMINLQLLDGISFKKGCYTGQEVVARMQYLGKLKRRMYRAQVRSEQPPRPGEELHCPSSGSVQATGRVVDASADQGEGLYELLAVVEIEAAEGGEVRLGGPNGPRLSFSEPPYGFPAQV